MNKNVLTSTIFIKIHHEKDHLKDPVHKSTIKIISYRQIAW